MTNLMNAISNAVEVHKDAADNFPVNSKGRPSRQPEDAARRALRRIRFGNLLRALRNERNLTLHRAAVLSGLSSARKLAQYETTCYVPGDVLSSLAKVYGANEERLAWALVEHRDPDLYRCLRGESGYEPSDDEISAYIRMNANNGA